MKIAVIGLGFVGLTTALGLASKGLEVSGFDNNNIKLDSIKKGDIPFYEEGLSEALERVLNKKFYVASSLSDALLNAEAVFFCVGTPCNNEGEANLEYLKTAVKDAIKFASDKCVFIVKSTVPPGTTENIVAPLAGGRSVAMNPEFLREGCAWYDFMYPDRIVAGVDDDRAAELMNKIYESFNVPIYLVSRNTAEFIKYLSNTLLANLISFSNEMAGLAETIGNINISNTFKVLCEDKRLKDAGICSYIYPGCGYGGSCLPKDTTALLTLSKKYNYSMPILNSIIQTNLDMPARTAEKIISNISDKNANIGILGLSFKPNSDDVRYSPATTIVNELHKQGYNNIFAYDPLANETFADANKSLNINYCNSADDVCKCCDVVAIVTTWQEFSEIDKKYPNINFVDCRYFLDGEI